MSRAEIVACETCGSAQPDAAGRTRGAQLIAMSRVGYVIAELEPTEVVARALLDYAARYAETEDGAVPYKQWPAALKGHFLCRFPKATEFTSTELGPQNPDELTRAPQEQ
jgi:predicted metal-binding protein